MFSVCPGYSSVSFGALAFQLMLTDLKRSSAGNIQVIITLSIEKFKVN
jgi:hypothetical protein